MQPVHQATVKAKVSGDVRQLTVREGDTVQAGPGARARGYRPTSRRGSIERQGQLESARAQLALAEKNLATNQKLLKQNFISQNAFDSTESSLNVARGSVKSAEAQVRLAQNALKDAVAVGAAIRHRRQATRAAGREGGVRHAAGDDRRPARDGTAGAGAGGGHPRAQGRHGGDLTVDGFGERKFTGRIERINPSTEAGHARDPGLRRHSQCQQRTARRDVRDRPRRAGGEFGRWRRSPRPPSATKAGQTFVWAIEDGKLVKRPVVVGRRDEESGRVEIKTALPESLKVLATRFDNLKEGAPALRQATLVPCGSAGAAPRRTR